MQHIFWHWRTVVRLWSTIVSFRGFSYELNFSPNDAEEALRGPFPPSAEQRGHK